MTTSSTTVVQNGSLSKQRECYRDKLI